VLAILIAYAAGADDDAGPTHVETEPIRIELGEDGKIETMAMDARGRLLLGVSTSMPAGPDRLRPAPPAGRPQRRQPPDDGPRNYAVKVVSQDGKVADTWALPEGLASKMIHACGDGAIYVCGGGRLALLDAEGKVQKQLAFADVLDGNYAGAHASGVTAGDDYFFLAFGDGFSLRATEDVVRFNRDLSSPKVIVQTQYGCCSHIDLDVKDGLLLVAENSRHRVNRFTLDGERVDTWGRRDRTSIEGFAACCNPVNFDFGPGGVLYTAESGIGRVKRYTADGKYLGMVGYVDTTKFDGGSRLAAQSCYIPVEVADDGKRVYVMDVRAQIIRVLEQK
jgi:hypothetical protein